jgi:hypothetical protein
MPPRSVILAIVAFWLLTTGVFLYNVIAPQLAQSEPVQFPVDLVDEAGSQTEGVSWLVFKNGGGGYRANTDWEYVRDNDTFRSRCQLARGLAEEERPRDLGGAGLPQISQVVGDSYYYLTRAGQMTRLEAKTTYRFPSPNNPEEEIEAVAKLSGSPHEGHFVPHVEMSLDLVQDNKKLGPLLPENIVRDATPVPVLARGLVLNPLHPPRRLPDLHPGQRWRVTLIDPFAILDPAAVLGERALNLLRKAGIDTAAVADTLDAEVLPSEESVFWQEKSETVVCRVIRCRGEGPFPEMTLWVRPGDGLLLKQETVTRSSDVWTFFRRPMNFRMHLNPNALEPPKK